MNDHQYEALTRSGLSPDALGVLAALAALADGRGFVQISDARLAATCREMPGQPVYRTIRSVASELERAGLVLRLPFCIDPDRSYYGPCVWLLRLPEEP